MKKYRHLTWDDRIRIETLLKQKFSVSQIASAIGFSRQTVYNELKRGRSVRMESYYDHYGYEKLYRYRDCYSPDVAQAKYDAFLREKGAPIKLGCDYEFASYLEHCICDLRLSPACALGKIVYDGLHFETSVCVSTVYSYIYKEVFSRASVKDLYFRGKRRKEAFCKKNRSRDCSGVSIEKRPDLSSRDEFGHWELDCVCGSSRSCLLTLVERKTRFLLCFKMSSQKAENVVSVLDSIESRLGSDFGKIFKTITCDNGSEFSDYSRMRRSVFSGFPRCEFYYSHPYSAYERGTNERVNRDIRRLVKKGSDIAGLSDEFVSSVQGWVNALPRSLFGWECSDSVFKRELEKLSVTF